MHNTREYDPSPEWHASQTKYKQTRILEVNPLSPEECTILAGLMQSSNNMCVTHLNDILTL